MADNEILDSQITASSVFSSVVKPSFGRLNLTKNKNRKGGWSAGQHDTNPWLQVDFLVLTTVTKISTQGRQDLRWWTKTYKISYSFDGASFEFYKKDGQIKVRE